MEKENSEELFSIRLNDEGIGHLLRFSKAIKLYLIAGTVWSFITFVDSLIYIMTKNPDYQDSLLNLYFSTYPFISVITIIIFIFQLFIYNKLNLAIQRAVHNSDEDKFNAALQYLSKSLWIAVLLNGFSIVVGILSLIISIKVRL